jgi:lactate dehydrogenase-like 2-hydroxyacid dehydrogenase
MQIAFFDLEEWQADYLQAGLQQLGLAEQVQAHYSTEHLTLEDCARYAACEAIAVFVWTKITRPILDALPQLRRSMCPPHPRLITSSIGRRCAR